MTRIIALTICCLLVSPCGALRSACAEETLDAIGSFELNPVQPDHYWYNGKSYEYNEYQIEITAEPSPAQIQWNGKSIGTTPLVYRFTGTLDRDDYIKVRAAPLDENLRAQEAKLRVRTELPRKIHFDLDKKR